MLLSDHENLYKFKRKIDELIVQGKGDDLDVSEHNVEALKTLISLVPESIEIFNETDIAEVKLQMSQHLNQTQEELNTELIEFYNDMPLSDIIPNDILEARKNVLINKCKHILMNKHVMLASYEEDSSNGLYPIKNKEFAGWWHYNTNNDVVYFNPCDDTILFKHEFEHLTSTRTIKLHEDNKIKQKNVTGTKSLYMTNIDFKPFENHEDTFYLTRYLDNSLLETHGLYKIHGKTFTSGDIHGIEYNNNIYWNDLIDAKTSLMEYDFNHLSQETPDNVVPHVEEHVANKLKFKPTI
jgi:hypothetical protein